MRKELVKNVPTQELSFEKALEVIRKHLQENQFAFDSENIQEKRMVYRDEVAKCLINKKLKVYGYEDSKDAIDNIVEELIGYSVLKDAMDDPEITDIYALNHETIFIENYKGEYKEYHKKWESPKHYHNTIERFLRNAKLEINPTDKSIVDFELGPNRGCVIHSSVATSGYALAIRKHGQKEIAVNDLIKQGVISEEEADFIEVIIKGGSNVIMAGVTGSGKTTSINAFLDAYVEGKRVMTAEDTRELNIANKHTVYLQSRKSSNPESNVSLANLVTTMLRMKPKVIVVGEIREEESVAAVESMETGHCTIFTMHAGSPMDAVNRLVIKYLTVMPALGSDTVERIIASAVDYIMIQDDIPGVGKRITSITEVTFEDESKNVKLTPIWKLSFESYEPELVNAISPIKAEKMLRRGVSKEKLEKYLDK